jgi:CDP-alcohol phosphatidyltransferase
VTLKIVDSYRFVILADESANWKIAGLPQLDRLVLALNEFAKSLSSDEKIEIVVFWKPEISMTARWLPNDSRLTRVQFGTSLEPGGSILATHLLVERNSAYRFIQKAPIAQLAQPIDDLAEIWRGLFGQFEKAYQSRAPVNAEKDWHLVATAADIEMGERHFLRGTGKSQDGVVARFFDRPISRSLVRLLLKSSVTPSAWTISIFPLSLVAVFFLVRGDYVGLVIGTAIFKLYDILDGCDGEIARAKYLASAQGEWLDTWCDICGNILLVLGVGFGLGRARSSFYSAEGILTGLIIAVNEWFLHGAKSGVGDASGLLESALYLRHRQLVHGSGLTLLGEKFVWWLIQLTKRDVAVVFFVFLASINQPQWILHLSLAVAAASLFLSLVARGRHISGRLTSLSGS